MATTLLVCCLCHKRVSPASHVLVRSLPAHQACGDAHYRSLFAVIEKGTP